MCTDLSGRSFLEPAALSSPQTALICMDAISNQLIVVGCEHDDQDDGAPDDEGEGDDEDGGGGDEGESDADDNLGADDDPNGGDNGELHDEDDTGLDDQHDNDDNDEGADSEQEEEIDDDGDDDNFDFDDYLTSREACMVTTCERFDHAVQQWFSIAR